MTTPEDANTVAGGSPVERGVGRPVPEREDVDALLADPTYYEPRIAKTPLPRGRYECACGKVLGCWRCGGR